MIRDVAFIGFGEAAQIFTAAPGWRAVARGFDIKTEDPMLRTAKLTEFEQHGVRACETCAEATSGGATVLSLVTADQALHAAQNAAQHLSPGTLFLDMNSVAPQRKQAASEAIAAAGGRYVDVAIMAPVQPKALTVPLLLSGPRADEAAALLTEIGFSNIRAVGDRIGQASAIKMVRSVMIKGIEALTAECLLAADAAGVTEDVLASLGEDWAERAYYNLERMLVHGHRRAAEMEDVCATLESLGIEPLLTRGTIQWQRDLGEIGFDDTTKPFEARLTKLRSDRTLKNSRQSEPSESPKEEKPMSEPAIPGTRLFNGDLAQKGYALNRMCFSFNEARNRAAFLADEDAYCERFGLNDEQRAAVRARNVLQLISAGGNVYYLAKFAGIFGLNVQDLGAQQTGVTADEFRARLSAYSIHNERVNAKEGKNG
ncbi:MAG: protocatechuate 4,5-dioxygenase subunit alpha [Hyphomonas sp.]|uniref:protocatechuate 4,5-dioxygenase subunit alpha n=1 Tax=Hyphomonas sp. TaxID=87 RepID=UPI003526E322